MKRSILSLIYLIKGMRHAGIDVDPGLGRIGICVDALDPNAILHSSIEWNIQKIIGQQVSAEYGLLVGQHYALAGYGPLLMLMLSCERVEDALNYAVHFQKLTHLYGVLTFEKQDGLMVLGYQPLDLSTEIGKFRAQCEVSSIFKFIHDLYKMMDMAGPRVQVNLPFPPPEALDLLKQYYDYYGENVEFEAKVAQFRIDCHALEFKIPSADTFTCRLYEKKCTVDVEKLTDDCEPDTLVERIKDYLDLQIGILPTMAETALALNVPERTLRHQLSQLQTSYKQIREQLIQRKALAFIREGSYPIAAIAERLGYSETAAFNHAFKRWFGASPSQYKE